MPTILIVTTVHHPFDARIWQRQIRTLLEQGWHVTYAAPFAARGVSLEDLGMPNPGNLQTIDLPRAEGRRRLRALLAARRLIARKGKEVDLVLIHDPELLLAISRAPSVVWDVHEDTRAALVAKAWLPAPARALARALIGALERRAERRAHLILAEYGYAEHFSRSHPVVPNAVEVPPRAPTQFEPRAAYLGTVTLERGARELTEVGRLLHPHIALDVIGPAHGEAAQVLREAHERGHLRWHGFVPSGQALAMLPGAIAGLSLLQNLPNYRHSMPTKLIEYMGHGVPVVTTPLPVATELVTRAGGVVIPFGDARAAAEEIRSLWQEQARARQIAESAYAVAAADYDWATHGSAFEQMLRNWALGAK